jgi:hypothetical protein
VLTRLCVCLASSSTGHSRPPRAGTAGRYLDPRQDGPRHQLLLPRQDRGGASAAICASMRSAREVDQAALTRPPRCALPLQTYKDCVDHLSLFKLLKIYQTSWCYPSGMDDMDPLKFRCIPRPKDFADFADYFVRKVGRCLRPPLLLPLLKSAPLTPAFDLVGRHRCHLALQRSQGRDKLAGRPPPARRCPALQR